MNDVEQGQPRRRRRLTAAERKELMQQIASKLMRRAEADTDDEYLRRWRGKVEENFRAAAPLKADLARVGIHVATISELMNYRLGDLPAAIPVLLRWLPRMENLDIKEAIVRALTDKAAKPLAAPALIEEFRKAAITQEARMLDLKWAIGNALSVVADDSVFDDLVELLTDERHGAARELLALALLNMKRPQNRARAEEILIHLADKSTGEGPNADFTPVYAVRALGRMKSSKGKAHVRRFLEHPDPDVRKAARKALERIEKAEAGAREESIWR